MPDAGHREFGLERRPVWVGGDQFRVSVGEVCDEVFCELSGRCLLLVIGLIASGSGWAVGYCGGFVDAD